MPAPKGHPCYGFGEGRPPKHDETFCNQLADEFLEWWYNHPEKYWFYSFFLFEKRLTKEQVARLAKKSPKLKEALKLAFQMQESRIFEASIDKACDQNTAKFALTCKHRWTPPPQKVKTTIEQNGETKTLLQTISGKSAGLLNND